MTIRRLKRAIRQQVIARILAMSPDDRARQESALVDAFPSLPGFATARAVLLYNAAFPEEFATNGMLRTALGAGKRVAFPRVNRESRSLDLVLIRDLPGDFEPGTLGIPEPARHLDPIPPDEIDWVLVPGVAYDRRGYRIGRGAGHYDRLLPRLRPEVPCWALAFDEQWVEAVPDEPHDQPLDGILSPRRRWAAT